MKVYLKLGTKPDFLKVLTESQFIKPSQFVISLWEKYLEATEEWSALFVWMQRKF